MRDLWALLPTAARARLWPATFAFSNEHRFHVVVMPHADGPEWRTYAKEAEAGDYPEGRYEFALQTAVEDGNQGEFDGLLARRSRGQTIWLAIGLVAGFSSSRRRATPRSRTTPAAAAALQKQAKINDEHKPHLPAERMGDSR